MFVAKKLNILSMKEKVASATAKALKKKKPQEKGHC
jgi:hypothetical protein